MIGFESHRPPANDRPLFPSPFELPPHSIQNNNNNSNSNRNMCDYYDKDAILATTEACPVNLTHGLAAVGRYVDPCASANDLPPNTRVEVPFWIVPTLAARALANVGTPRAVYGHGLSADIGADPGCVDLRARSPYFYELAMKVSGEKARQDDTQTLADDPLMKLARLAFQGRYRDLLVKALSGNCEQDKAVRTLPSLTSEERELFESAREAARVYEQWRNTEEPRLRASRTVTNVTRGTRKRSRGA